MIFFQDSKIEGISINKVGNKTQDEFYELSESTIDLDLLTDEVKSSLMDYFWSPFAKTSSVYRLCHPSDYVFNIAHARIFDFFTGHTSLLATSHFLTQHLYEVSTHPKIKSGDFIAVALSNVIFEGETFDAIALFKSDKKEQYLEMEYNTKGYDISVTMHALTPNNLDKAAIILNTERDKGYKVLIKDGGSAFDTAYWRDEFLRLKVRNDDYQKTTDLLKLTKEFVISKLDDSFDLDPTDKADLLNRTMDYFKNHESVEIAEFGHDVLQNKEVISMYTEYVKCFEDEFEVAFGESFAISSAALKKVQNSFKSVIKLDKNFHIYIHGQRDFIERGYDENKGLNYYKVYFQNEA